MPDLPASRCQDLDQWQADTEAPIPSTPHPECVLKSPVLQRFFAPATLALRMIQCIIFAADLKSSDIA
ncbi:hypothetical protein [Planctomycetes bacterium SV_7m_r]|uniref:hypothetical protein n=1 Tax=Stieleria bergensis TaxID=2528025 RepID=UPI0011A99741